MDRRSFLGLFGAFSAAAFALNPTSGEAMPAAKPQGAAPAAPGPAVATDADMQSAQIENVYWRRRRWRVYRRYYRRRWRRRYVRYYYRPRVYYYRWGW